MTNLFKSPKRVPRSEQEARVVSGGDASAHEGGQVFEFGANTDQCAEDAGGEEQEREASKQTPCR